jgi:hypothetical protein
LLEKKFITLDGANLSLAYTQHFPTLTQLISSPVTFGFSKIGSVDSLSLSIGIWLWMCLLFFVAHKLSRLWNLALPTYFDATILTAIFALIVFQLSVTTIIWEHLPFASFIQFPWRLQLLLSVVSAGLGRYWDRWPTFMKVFLGLIVVIQMLIMARVHPIDRFHRTNVDYMAFSQTTTTQHENMPKTFTFTDIGNWQPTPSILSGSARTSVTRWSGSNRTYTVEVITPTIITEPTMYFPGWKTTVTALPSMEHFQANYLNSEAIQGRIAYQLEPGNYIIRTKFTEQTTARLIGDTISLISIFCIFVWFYKTYSTST